MKPLLLLITCISLVLFCQGQSILDQVKHVNTVTEAENFILNNKASGGKIFILDSGRDTSELELALYSKKPGYTFLIDQVMFKILQLDSLLSFRVNYIYLSGEHYSSRELDSLGKKIIAEYKAGRNFFELVREYNMDGNFTGDTGWFGEKMMVPEFETAVRSHKQGDIFVVETPAQKWFHVVLKSHEDTFIKKLTVLKVNATPAR